MTSNTLRQYWTRIIPALLVVVAVACGPLRRGAADPAQLVFTNDALTQADVYIVPQGLDARRVGTVMPGQTRVLNVPMDITSRAGTVNIVARLLARSDAPRTGPVTLIAGERYQVRLPMSAELLSFLPAG